MDNLDINFLKDNLKELNIELSETQINMFVKYYELLVEWNSFMNLTAITEWKEVVIKHFIDSLSLVNVIENMTDVSYSVLDIGTGAGFPGIPLKIAFPNLKITLVDSLNKRVKFLNEVINVLGLENIVAIHSRAEDIGHNSMYREQYDIVVSRAVSNLTVLAEYCVPFVKLNGCFIPYKSEKSEEELSNASKALSILGCKYINSVDFDLPSSDIFRCLLVFEKIKNTPNKFPRKAGLPTKDPIC